MYFQGLNTIFIIFIYLLSQQNFVESKPTFEHPEIENGNVEVLDNGHRLIFSCNEGFELVGLKEIVYVNKIWSGSTPICIRAKTQLSFPHGYYKVSLNGQKFSFVCNEGYFLQGAKEIYYVDNKWLGNIPNCVRADVQINFPFGSYMVSESGKKYTFSCDEEYNLLGEKEIYYINQKWTNSIPICIHNERIDPVSALTIIKQQICPKVENIVLKNGLVEKEENLCKFRFKCEKQFTLVGESEIEFLDEKWNNPMPLCVPNQLLEISDGSFQVKIVSEKDIILYACDNGYQLVGSNRLEFLNGELRSKKPSCLLSCPPIEFFFGSVETDPITHVANFTCDNGYQLSGDSVLICENGNWSDSPPSCQPLCPKINLVNGDVVYKEPNIATFVCKENYFLMGNDQSVCNNGKWKQKTPVCINNPKCPELKITKEHEILEYGFEGNYYKIACIKGYTLIGNEEINCNFGQWNNPIPICKYNKQEYQVTNGHTTSIVNY